MANTNHSHHSLEGEKYGSSITVMQLSRGNVLCLCIGREPLHRWRFLLSWGFSGPGPLACHLTVCHRPSSRYFSLPGVTSTCSLRLSTRQCRRSPAAGIHPPMNLSSGCNMQGKSVVAYIDDILIKLVSKSQHVHKWSGSTGSRGALKPFQLLT